MSGHLVSSDMVRDAGSQGHHRICTADGVPRQIIDQLDANIAKLYLGVLGEHTEETDCLVDYSTDVSNETSYVRS